MFRRRSLALLALVVVAAQTATDDDFPRFKSDQKRESKEFLGKVGEQVLKAARSKPQKVEYKEHSYAEPRKGRKELTLKMTYAGAVTKAKFTADIVILLDVEDKDKWEVLKISYKDSNRSPIPFSDKKVQALIKKFNE